VKHLLGCIVCYFGHAIVSILPASAEPSTADALERYRLGDPAMFAFLSGNLNGWTWANADLEAAGKAKLFCAPPSLDLSVQRQVEVTTEHLKDTPADGSRPVGSVMLQSLKQAFPCK
jgi:hypothetical protein